MSILEYRCGIRGEERCRCRMEDEDRDMGCEIADMGVYIVI